METGLESVAAGVRCGYYRGEYLMYVNGTPRIRVREWRNNEFNFDDVSQAMLSLFTVTTFEGWPV